MGESPSPSCFMKLGGAKAGRETKGLQKRTIGGMVKLARGDAKDRVVWRTEWKSVR